MSRSNAPAAPANRWLLLIHQIPPKPDYLRVKIGRRLQRVGAVPVKNSVYVLPDSEGAFEDFQWIRSEIVAGGGDASICRAAFIDGLSDAQVRQLFRAARDADYAEVDAAAKELLQSTRSRSVRPRRGTRTTPPDTPSRAADELAKLKKRLAAIEAVDFFAAPAGPSAQAAVARARASLEPPPAAGTPREHPRAADRAAYKGCTWVTRENVFVDRMASAWLIQRFIDNEARFRFVPGDNHRPARGARELRFDMFEGEFTHEGDRCTFETLMARFALDDPALGAIAEIVHDIDLKDGKFERIEAPGIERILAGIVRAHADDATRVERARQIFDELYALHETEAAPQAKARSSIAKKTASRTRRAR
jgi:hypothetical protein